MKIEILKSKDNQWYFRCVAKNGRILCHSETYRRLSDAKKGAESLARGVLSSLLYVCPEFEWVKTHKGNYRLAIHSDVWEAMLQMDDKGEIKNDWQILNNIK